VEIYNTLLTMLLGYLDRLSVGAGEQARARLSAPEGPPEVEVIRLSHGDPAPAGPGLVATECPWPVAALRPVTE
jgi:hypothetical protein